MSVPKESGRKLPASIPVGALATITMDVVMVIASRVAAGAFASDKMSLEAIGRWTGGLGRGRRRHGDISAAPKLRGELALGLATHYLTGMVLTEAYFVLLRRSGLGPGPAKATAYGLATSVLPLLVLYPSMGYGCCARRSDDAASLVRLMLLGHTAFGAGLGLWAALLRGRAPAA